jgi:hypothetical protein
MMCSLKVSVLLVVLSATSAQELLWERTGERERSSISGWAVPFGDVDQDGFEDWIAQAVAYIDLGGGPDMEAQLWVLSGLDGRTLRVRGRYRPLRHGYDVICAAGDMDRDGIGDYAFTVFDVRNPPVEHIVEVCSGRDDSLIWRQSKATPCTLGVLWSRRRGGTPDHGVSGQQLQADWNRIRIGRGPSATWQPIPAVGCGRASLLHLWYPAVADEPAARPTADVSGISRWGRADRGRVQRDLAALASHGHSAC